MIRLTTRSTPLYSSAASDVYKRQVETLNYGVFLDVYDDFAYEDKMNMNYSLDGLHLNDLGYNILNVRLSKEL